MMPTRVPSERDDVTSVVVPPALRHEVAERDDGTPADKVPELGKAAHPTVVRVVCTFFRPRVARHDVLIELIAHHLGGAHVEEGPRGQRIEGELEPGRDPRDPHADRDSNGSHRCECPEEKKDLLSGAPLAHELHPHGQGGGELVRRHGEEESDDVPVLRLEPERHAREERVKADGKEEHQGRHGYTRHGVHAVDISGLGGVGEVPRVRLVADNILLVAGVSVRGMLPP
mmetsp:Transcript_65012/g.205397  ORF Transcript_65012/g.205397 Transcript_65012/m.205397 type:complete len:229 (+) Transcript_65012:149-835(+)